MTLDNNTKTSARTNDSSVDNKKTTLPTEKVAPNKPSTSGSTESKDAYTKAK